MYNARINGEIKWCVDSCRFERSSGNATHAHTCTHIRTHTGAAAMSRKRTLKNTPV